MKLTTDERQMLAAIDDDAHGDLKINPRSPILESLRQKRLIIVSEDGDYQQHVRLTRLGRAALGDSP